MGGGAENADAAGGVFDDGEDVQPSAGQGSGFEEVGGEDRVRLAAQKRRPGLAFSAGYGFDTGVLEDLPDRRRGDLDPKGGQFAVDAPVAPAGVFMRQPQDQPLDAANGGRSAGPLGPGRPCVVAAEQVTVPAQDGVGRDDQIQLAQPWPW